MKPTYNFKKIVVLIAGLIHHINATPVVEMSDYIRDCAINNRESVLIVGCGHIDDAKLVGNHLHRDAYCVDIDNPEKFMDVTGVKLKSVNSDPSVAFNPHWQLIKADAYLDITAPLHHVAKFNTVVLERIWSKSLEFPYTLYNAAALLNEGGILTIDLHYSYNLYQYQASNERSLLQQVYNSIKFSGGLNPQYNFSCFGFYDTTVSADEIKSNLDGLKCQDKVESQLKRFGYDLKKRPKMRDMYNGLIHYLNDWGFENVIYINDRVQPYTFDSAVPGMAGRKGDFIVATKSVVTTQSMLEWLNAIKRFSKKK